MTVREKKAEIIEGLEKLFSECTIGILTEYRGITGNDITTMRRKLEASQLKFKVVKNTLGRFAAEKAGKGYLKNTLKGPQAIAFSNGEISDAARTVLDYLRMNKSVVTVKGAFTGDRLLNENELKFLATLPARPQLIAQLIGNVQGPISMLLAYLNAPVQELVGTLEAKIKQMEAK